MKLFCLGDSLTFGFGVPRAARWTALLEKQTDWQAVNLGVNGDTTGGMLARLGPEVIDRLGEPHERLGCRVLLMGGSNDVFFSGTDAQARANMAAMCHRLLGERMRPLVGVSLPVDWQGVSDQWAAAADFENAARVMAQYCAWLKTFCRAFDLPVVDFAADFLDEGGRPRHEFFLDGLHPNPAGHQLMARRLIRALGSHTEEETAR